MSSDRTLVQDALAGQVAAELLARSHVLPPEQVAETIMEIAGRLGVIKARVYLADLQQQQLRAMPGGEGSSPGILPIDSTVAGRVYRTLRTDGDLVDDGGDSHLIWIPLVDGTERLGVLELTVTEVSDAMLARYTMLASWAAMTIVSKTHYSDIYAQTRRSEHMAVQAEMVWAFLPPRTFTTDRFTVTATLEPAYAVGGDAYDYSLLGDHLYVSVFDAAGHDLAAGLLASVAMAACRSTRRSGGALQDMVTRADHAIASQFGGSRFVTALLCDLDLATGRLKWIPCGHPPPLLIRGADVVRELSRQPQLPLGLADRIQAVGDENLSVCTETLEPGDRVLAYTDGVVEGQAADGSRFGVDRLSDFILRSSHTDLPAPETIRRLTGAISDFQHGRLFDDATIVLIEWLPESSLPELPAEPAGGSHS